MHCPHIRQGLRINHDGNMVPCCVFTDKSDSYVQSEGFSHYQNSDWLKAIEDQLASGKWPKGCSSCAMVEANGSKSQRMNPPVGFNVEIVLGNVCNSDCGMCGPDRSSMIASRLKRHPHPHGLIDHETDRFLIPTGPVERFELDKMDGVSEILIAADSIKLIGGEPFLIKELWKTLDILSDKNPNVKLEIMTNASLFDEMQLEILRRFTNLHLYFSADAAEDHYEWIRHGLDWQQFKRNLDILRKLAKYSVITATVSALNVTALRSLGQYAYDIGMFIQFWPISNPKLLNLENVSSRIIADELKAWEAVETDSKKNEIFKKMLMNHLKTVLPKCPDDNDPRLIKYINYLNPLRKHKLDAKDLVMSKKTIGTIPFR